MLGTCSRKEWEQRHNLKSLRHRYRTILSECGLRFIVLGTLTMLTVIEEPHSTGGLSVFRNSNLVTKSGGIECSDAARQKRQPLDG